MNLTFIFFLFKYCSYDILWLCFFSYSNFSQTPPPTSYPPNFMFFLALKQIEKWKSKWNNKKKWKKRQKISMESILYWPEVWLMYPGSLHWRKLFPFPAGINGLLVRDGTLCLLAFLGWDFALVWTWAGLACTSCHHLCWVGKQMNLFLNGACVFKTCSY